MQTHFLTKNSISHAVSLLAAGLLALLFGFCISFPTHAAETGAVTVAPSNNGVGVVSCTRNGTSFTNYTYADATDYITVSALPLNKEYNFLHWTDNGVIVSNSSTYSFSVGTKNHLVIAHFDQKAEYKGDRYDSDKNRTSLTRNTPACDYASGYKIDGMALNTTLVTIDDATRSAVEAMTGGSFVSAFRISFTFGYDGKAKDTLDHKVQLVLQLSAPQTNGCSVTMLSNAAPVILPDLDDNANTVTFETNKSAIYVITAPSAVTAVTPVVAAPVVPDVVAPVAVPAAVAVPEATSTPVTTTPVAVAAPVAVATPAPVTEAQYQEAVINILRYQLQQAGLTPIA